MLVCYVGGKLFIAWSYRVGAGPYPFYSTVSKPPAASGQTSGAKASPENMLFIDFRNHRWLHVPFMG